MGVWGGVCVCVSLQLTNLLGMQPTFCILRAGNASLIPGEGRSEGMEKVGGIGGLFLSGAILTHPCCLPALPMFGGGGCLSPPQGLGLAQLTKFAVPHLCK